MTTIALPAADLRVSRFIFGLASLFNVGPRAQRLHLLDAAYDHGFTHFDTAPYYGFGMADRDLAPLLARRRDVTMTTKVGLYSPGGEAQSALSIFVRKAAGRALPALSRPERDWRLARARGALEGSLRRLGRDHIDLYMLHEPDFAAVDSDDWLRWLEAEAKAGRVLRFGLALEAQSLTPFLAANSPLAKIVQTTDSLDQREADLLRAYNRPLQITYGYISAARTRQPEAAPAQVLAQALQRNAEGAIIVSTRKVSRLAELARLRDTS